MTAIVGTTSNQYFQSAQSAQPTVKADAVKIDTSAPVANKPTEYNSTKNADGTYGPKHTKLPPSATQDVTVLSGAAALDIQV